MSITVLDPGPLTTVQDAGRLGYAAQGYRTCGAADSYAYRLSNALVGNTPGAAVLECTLRGAALRFEQDTIFALTGAESPAALDGTPCRITHRCWRKQAAHCKWARQLPGCAAIWPWAAALPPRRCWAAVPPI